LLDSLHIDALRSLVAPGNVIDDPERLEPHLTEWRGAARGQTPLLLMPSDTEQVSAILRYSNRHRISVVPQGGNTGLCGGAIPDTSNEQIVLNLSRMNRVRSVEPDNFSMTVEAGCILSDLQQEALRCERYFPLSLAAETSCEIGGNLATDAGGINVIRYGTARDQVLGLEVVLANGDVIEGLRGLRKDTAGYDLKQLFIGSEGTLGVVTAATLKLYPNPGERATALVQIDTAEASVLLLSALRSSIGDRIEAFELLSPVSVEFLQRHRKELRFPFDKSGCSVLVEIAGANAAADLETALGRAHDQGLATDIVVAKNDDEATRFWRLRHSLSAVQKLEGASLKHDVAVPIDRVPALLDAGQRLIAEHVPGARLCAFGHVGDGNLHYNVSQPVDADPDIFREAGKGFTAALYAEVRRLGGTFSAEHGVGVFKKHYLSDFRSPVELSVMRALKASLDPNGILNPGKVI